MPGTPKRATLSRKRRRWICSGATARRSQAKVLNEEGIGISISTIRVVGLILLTIVPASAPELRIGLSFWIGFLLSFAAGELWVRKTCTRRVAVRYASVRAAGA